MSKESISTQVEYAKQELSHRRLEMQKKAERGGGWEEQIRSREVTEIKRAAETIIQETIKNFSGTNIIETLEEIRDKRLLDNGTYKTKSSIGLKKIFERQNGRFQTGTLTEKNPMLIYFNTNYVTAIFDFWCQSSENSCWDSSGFMRIKIIKDNDNFRLEYGHQRQQNTDRGCYTTILKETSRDPSVIIDQIVKIVAERQLK